jgi:hypothetical protein
VTQVTFTLPQTSKFIGYAMNSGSDPSEDFKLILPNGTPATGPVTVSFSGNVATVSLKCYDYGGFALASVTAGAQTAQIRIPKDENLNSLPDVGWIAEGVATPDQGGPGDDTDPGPTGNMNAGDGLTAFEEYRGFVIQGQHQRTRADVKQLFVQNAMSALFPGLGFTPALGIDVIEVFAGELDGATRQVNYNYINAGSGYLNPQHYLQKGLVVENGGYSGPNGDWGQTGNALGNPPGPKLPSNTVFNRVFVDRIREGSPTNNSQTVPDSVDATKVKQSIAHEFGHSLNLGDVEAVTQTQPYVCPIPNGDPRDTVMVTHYFNNSNGLDQWACAWNNVPTSYTAQELSSFLLR